MSVAAPAAAAAAARLLPATVRLVVPIRCWLLVLGSWLLAAADLADCNDVSFVMPRVPVVIYVGHLLCFVLWNMGHGGRNHSSCFCSSGS